MRPKEVEEESKARSERSYVLLKNLALAVKAVGNPGSILGRMRM